MMDVIEQDTLQFFAGHSSAVPIYRTFEQELLKRFPDISVKVQKTQISFSGGSIFACVSFLRVKKKRELPDPYLVITLRLSYPLESHRVAVKTEPYPGRWTTHIVVGSADELDEELFQWVKQAYDFSVRKRHGG